MTSKLRDILERLYGNAVVAHKTIGISNAKSVDVPEAEKAIRQAVGEEMLELVKSEPTWESSTMIDAESLIVKIKEWSQS